MGLKFHKENYSIVVISYLHFACENIIIYTINYGDRPVFFKFGKKEYKLLVISEPDYPLFIFNILL